MSFETLKFERDGAIATITLSRADSPANALNAKMAEELFEVAVMCGDKDVRAVIFTAEGRMFCGGGDLAEMDASPDRPAHLRKMASLLHAAVSRLSHNDAPVVTAVNGTAGGGGFSLALAGDVILAAEGAKFVSAYTASGLTPDGSSTYFLAKHVGLLRAKELVLTNRVLSAPEAVDWGLATRVVAAEDLAAEARKVAEGFAAGPTKAYGGAKRLLETAYREGLESQMDRETRSIAAMMETHDGPEGINAFLNKRAPAFRGE
ncbi:MAG: enoyl-CoA hydratase-related protein [Pseudomonadota bacterium]